MSTLHQHIKELLIFYIQTNYNNYLKENNLTKIENDELKELITKLFEIKKEHSKQFIKDSLKTIYGEEYQGDAIINNYLNEIYLDETLCINKIILEIELYQKNNK